MVQRDSARRSTRAPSASERRRTAESACLLDRRLLDPTPSGVGGHSAGTTSGLSNAGAWQQWGTGVGPYRHADPRVDVYLLASPQGPMSAGFASGFQEGSFVGITASSLFISGVGDDTGEPAISRTTAFHEAVPGDKFLLWDTDARARHDTMNLLDCVGVTNANHRAWIGATAWPSWMRTCVSVARR